VSLSGSSLLDLDDAKEAVTASEPLGKIELVIAKDARDLGSQNDLVYAILQGMNTSLRGMN
jgi:hypothetical protein